MRQLILLLSFLIATPLCAAQDVQFNTDPHEITLDDDGVLFLDGFVLIIDGYPTDCLGRYYTNLVFPDYLDDTPVEKIRISLSFPLDCKIKVTYPSKIKVINFSLFDVGRPKPSSVEVVLPDSVEALCDYFLYDCQVDSFFLPKTVKYIGEKAFQNCGLTKLIIPEDSQLEYIGSLAFANNNISDLSLPKFLKKIDDDAFYSNKLSHIDLPTQLSYLGGFQNNEITYLTIPESVDSIGPNAFYDNDIESVTWNANPNLVLGSKAFMNNNIGGAISIPQGWSLGLSVFENNPNISQATFLGERDSIPSYLFNNCGLSSVQLPLGLKKIGIASFCNNNITSFAIPETVEELKSKCLSGNLLNEETCPLPRWSVKLGSGVFASNKFRHVSVPLAWGCVVPPLCFAFNADMVSLAIEDGITDLGDCCFQCCTNLSSLSLPTSVNLIWANAFCGVEALGEFPLPKSSPEQFWLPFHNNEPTTPHVQEVYPSNFFHVYQDFLYILMRSDRAPSSTTSVPLPTFSPDAHVVVYNISGLRVASGLYSELSHSLPSGLYVVRSSQNSVGQMVMLK